MYAVLVQFKGLLGAGCHAAAAANALCSVVGQLRQQCLGFRIAAPQAAQGTALEKDQGAYARTVVDRIVLYVEDCAACLLGHLGFLEIGLLDVSAMGRMESAPWPKEVRSQNGKLHLLVLGTGNEVVLQILGEFREVGAVACNTDNEAAVLLGILLGVDEGLSVDDVELHVPQP